MRVRVEGARLPPRRCWAVLITLLLLWSYAYATHPPGGFTQGGLIHGDGVYTYAYTRSLVLDADVDFANDYELLGNPHQRGQTDRGVFENRFSIGSGLLWTPTFVAGLAVAGTGRALGLTDAALDGSSPLVQRITLFGSVLLAWGTVVLVTMFALAFVGELAACLAGLAVGLATPLSWYAVYQPSWSHAASAFAIALLVVLWHRERAQLRTRRWIMLGVVVGFAALIRPQNAAFLMVPLCDLLMRLGARLRRGERVQAAPIGAAVVALLGGALVGFAPQMIVWQVIYGAPLTVPQGSGFLMWDEIRWSFTLFASRGGLFAWTPLAYLAIAALAIALARGAAGLRSLYALLLVAFAIQVAINGATVDWWGGWAYGGRRFLSCSIVFGLGIALGIDWLHRFVRSHERGVTTAIPVLLVATFAICNVEQMDDYLHGRMQRGEPTDMSAVSRRTAARLVDGVYDLVGHPWSAPASWLFAARADVPSRRWDLAAGQELVTGRANERGWEYLKMPDPRWTMAGFGPPVVVAGQPASWVTSSQASLVIGMREPITLDATLFLRPSTPGIEVGIEVNQREVFRQELEPGWQTYEAHIVASALRGGLSHVRIQQRLPPRPAPRTWTIGRTEARIDAELTARRDADGTMTVHANDTELRAPGPGVWVLGVDRYGALADLGRFDTRSRKGTAALVERLGAFGEGDVVIVVISSYVYDRWSAAASASLRRLGARLDPKVAGPQGYALIGVVGARPGTAVEASADGGIAVAEVGRPTDHREHGVAWGWITLAREGVTPRLPSLPMLGK